MPTCEKNEIVRKAYRKKSYRKKDGSKVKESKIKKRLKIVMV